ncbi:hypothetical protein FPZ54_09355 [Sphingomonas suaedae]|uniref:Uncharacterized protein n=1 Tax=Sphingomonas suaedae TaxID=2599297 RepID=A0A518RFG7_9SPHN|nr:hypothetical protein [Sphingomonas suaedae]QDX26205.1 hypothetical protein FPZ54_09355 [Sphingomonas suaedae]
MKFLNALVFALAALPVAAAAVPPERVSAETAASDATIERAELVRDLIARARADRDVAMMIVAARMLGEGDFVLVPAENAPLVLGRARTGDELPVTAPAALLVEARDWAEGDADKMAAIEVAQAEASKGILPSAIVYTHDLPAERTLTMRAKAEGGRVALVRVRGDGDAALELAVTDSDGRVACTDRPAVTSGIARRDLLCRWTPGRTEEYRITLKNKGRVWTRAILVSN